MPALIEIIQGDLAEQKVDAVVNAANTTLLGGGGVDGAIHRKAGPQLLEECRRLQGCMTGEAKLTKGYNLPARYVIHTVGPVWNGGGRGEAELLAACYRNSLRLAHQRGLNSIAFPSISTGAYGFPLEKACRIALTEIQKGIILNPELEKVVVVCFSSSDFEIYQRTWVEMGADKKS
jgi:O-acetyl-ADP-ribose deacetylase (regulator of RNase III)